MEEVDHQRLVACEQSCSSSEIQEDGDIAMQRVICSNSNLSY